MGNDPLLEFSFSRRLFRDRLRFFRLRLRLGESLFGERLCGNRLRLFRLSLCGDRFRFFRNRPRSFRKRISWASSVQVFT